MAKPGRPSLGPRVKRSFRIGSTLYNQLCAIIATDSMIAGSPVSMNTVIEEAAQKLIKQRLRSPEYRAEYERQEKLHYEQPSN